MRKIALIGGKLQGLEAAYLAQKAGWQVLLIDENPLVPARGLSNEFYKIRIKDKWPDPREKEELYQRLLGAELILPALEDLETLKSLLIIGEKLNIPVAFDLSSYEISASKIKSNDLFQKSNIPLPALWPQARLPLVVKPALASGSSGVLRIDTAEELTKILAQEDIHENWVLQEFLTGPSYSIEIIGYGGQYQVYEITDLAMDSSYDCKRVTAPVDISADLEIKFREIGISLAKSLNLNGIMDVEVILHQNELKVLEIDARLPSQTPTVVYHSSGVNLVEVLGNSFINGQLPVPANHSRKLDDLAPKKTGVIYEHIQVQDKTLRILGEGIMGQAGALQLIPDFFGADEALSNYQPGQTKWVATLINLAATKEQAWQKREQVIRNICKSLEIKEFRDDGRG